MANNILDVQISYDGGVRSPIITGASSSTNAGSRRLSFYNIAKLVLGMLAGLTYKRGSSYLQYQTTLVAASATATPAAVAAADTLSIYGTALTATQRRATGTVTAATAIAGNTATINGQVFTGTAGAVVLGDATFSIDTSNTATATSLAAQVNAYAGVKIQGIVKARSAAAVVTLYAVTQGTAGNAITLASSGATLAVSAATLANGAAITNNTFDFAGTDITTGQAIAAAILASTTAAVQRTTATASSSTGVVTVTAKMAGIAGNAATFTSSNGTRLAVTGSGFLAGGTMNDPVRLEL